MSTSSENPQGVPVVIDPDYAAFIVKARLICKQEGYALAIHGSTTRDLDLIAIPWAESACLPAALASRVSFACGWPRQHPDGSIAEMGEVVEATTMAFGRLQWSMMHPAWGLNTPGAPDPRYIDFSVIPPIAVDTEADDAPCSRMGYYRTAGGEWKENGIGMGWCKECGAKIRYCVCAEQPAISPLVLRLAELARRPHFYCDEDSWYTCPKHPTGCANPAAGTECNCGSDKVNAEVDSIMAQLKPPTNTEK